MAWRSERGWYWKPYVPVEKRRREAEKKARELARKGRPTEPVVIEGRTIASTFWGRSWCENLERYSDYENRLPRGRTYVRNGSVIDLRIEPGKVKALVSGSEIYTVSIGFSTLGGGRWRAIQKACSGKIDSVVELLSGKLSQGVMQVLTEGKTGLFPSPSEIDMDCSCPDWAEMCKHVAAVLYGVGARLDSRPDLLFLLRQVDQSELIQGALAGAASLGGGEERAMEKGEMEKIFDIEIDSSPAPSVPAVERGAGAPLSAPRRKVGRRKGVEPAGRRMPSGARGTLASRIPRLRRFFRGTLSIASSDYRSLFSLDGPATIRELSALVEQGTLIRQGRTRGTLYYPGPALEER